MNNQFVRQTEEMLNAVKTARIPENIKVLAEESVEKSREAFDKLQTVSKDGSKVLETVMTTAQTGARSISQTVLRNIERNAEAAFDAASEMARAKTVPEAIQIQASFVQQQMTASVQQTQELMGLSAKLAQQMFETMNSATLKTFEQFKKVG
ncbi:MAG: phasin [Hyphomicrobium sp. 32-62-53]|jgi:phasin|nr:MAG: phasin [Hyphomicrobium sp. 12-62-95]OYX97947.1 MAG: phasin [Hyphomicrobium sp. 32-62-53]